MYRITVVQPLVTKNGIILQYRNEIITIIEKHVKVL